MSGGVGPPAEEVLSTSLWSFPTDLATYSSQILCEAHREKFGRQSKVCVHKNVHKCTLSHPLPRQPKQQYCTIFRGASEGRCRLMPCWVGQCCLVPAPRPGRTQKIHDMFSVPSARPASGLFLLRQFHYHRTRGSRHRGAIVWTRLHLPQMDTQRQQ